MVLPGGRIAMRGYLFAGVVISTTIACGAQRVAAQAQTPVCVENSPERHGGLGCSILVDKPLNGPFTEPVYWHIDRFEALAGAEAVAGDAGIAVEAHGSAWLLTIESQTAEHRGGTHVAAVRITLPKGGTRYALQVLSASFSPGMSSAVHHHSGPEAWYVMTGEQCLQTTTGATIARAGETAVVPEGAVMKLVATGAVVRRAIAIIFHDADAAPTTREDLSHEVPHLQACR
jgi:quercetin dioxygenase-like cupin family protein